MKSDFQGSNIFRSQKAMNDSGFVSNGRTSTQNTLINYSLDHRNILSTRRALISYHI
jgi:hypothetical protein